MGIALGTIDLAVEPDFRLGPWSVCPSRGLATRDGAEVKLEPRVLQTLVVLVRAEGRTVSRAELMRTAWGLEVSDDAIARCIARLRAVLSEEGVIAVETIPKIGYRLMVTPPDAGLGSIVEEMPSVSLTPAPPPVRRWPWLLAGAVGAGAVLLGLGLWYGTGMAPVPSLLVSPLTTDPGQEIQPALSPGGGQLAYASDRAGAGFDLWLLSLGGGTPVRLTDHADADLSPAWSPDGGRIAFVRTDGRTPCRILVLAVPAGPERVVGECRYLREPRLTWAGNDQLIFTDRDRDGGPTRLFTLSLSGDGVPVALTDPQGGINGDGDAAMAPDGKRLAFMRHRAVGVADVMIRDMESGREIQVTEDGRKLHGVVWSGDGRWLYMVSSRAGDFGLWRVDPTGGTPPLRLAPGLNQLGQIAAGGDRIAVEMRSSRSQLLRIAPDGSSSMALPPSNRFDWDPDVGPDGSLAFASDRSGMFEIWVADASGAAAPVTRFEGPFTQSPRWAPDGRRLALTSIVDANPEIFILDRGNGKLIRVTDDAGEDRAPSWSRDGRRLFFASNRQGGWRIWVTRPPYDQAMPITEIGWRAAKESADGKWLYLAHESLPGLWRQPADGGDAEQVTDRLNPYDSENWAVGPAGVYLIDRPEGQAPRILLLPADGGLERVTATLPELLYKSALSVDRDGSVIVGQYQDTLVDIVEIRPDMR